MFPAKNHNIMNKRIEKKIELFLGDAKTTKFHEAMLAAEEDMLEEADFVPLEDDPDMEIILADEIIKD